MVMQDVWVLFFKMLYRVAGTSVADLDPGSSSFLIPASGTWDKLFLNPGSPTHIFESFVTNFGVKSTIILCQWFKFLLHLIKNKIVVKCSFKKR
jgi:hypothetical protein